jgi:methionyl-tRNA formyltransferase
MRIIFFGTPNFAVPSLQALIDSGEEVVAVVTQPDRVRGRSHKMMPPPVKEVAVDGRLAVLQPVSVKAGSFRDEIERFRPDVCAVVAYGKILPPPILGLPRLGCVNVHGSLLPLYRGAAPIQRALMNGDTTTGITTMMMDEGLDTGDILLQEEVAIADEDDARTLGLRLADIGASLLVRTIAGLRDGTVTPLPQEGDATFAPPLKKEDGRIRWTMDAAAIRNLIRGTIVWPGAYSFISGERVTITSASVKDKSTGSHPGRIESVGEEGFCVETGSGLLMVLEVKPDGKKIMSASAFLRGRRLGIGASFDAL